MLSRVRSSVINGLSARTVEVEVEVHEGKFAYIIIGMGDIAVRESRDRVLSALKNSGFRHPQRILVNLAPAELKKEGASFDLAIAVGILASCGAFKDRDLSKTSFHGELSLDGSIKPIKGVIAHAVAALERGDDELIVPRDNRAEGLLISGLGVTGVATLAELAAYLEGELIPDQTAPPAAVPPAARRSIAEVRGQQAAKRALQIAAAGGHNVLMVGPPGCGKSMLAERFPALLPPLTRAEMLQTVKIHSIAGLPIERLLEGERPFRNPHYVISEAGLIGGGSSAPRPGEVSLAHHGVLFLDEFPEFRRGALEGLRQPMESGGVRISRAKGSVEFPAAFQLVAAMNPCPCGRLGVHGSSCICPRSAIYAYLKKVSLPILDRIDLHIDVGAVAFAELQAPNEDDRRKDESARGLVAEARERALHRTGGVNARLLPHEIDRHVRPTAHALALLKRLSQNRSFSARGYFRILKVARSIADLAERDLVEDEDVAEAAGYRSFQRLEQYCMGGGEGSFRRVSGGD